MKYDNGSKTGVSCFEDGSKNHKPGTADALHKLEKKNRFSLEGTEYHPHVDFSLVRCLSKL